MEETTVQQMIDSRSTVPAQACIDASRYDTADFGGLGKKGVGLAIDLGSAQTVNQVVIESTGTGGAVELRTATAPTLAASTRVGAAKLTQPRLVLTLGAPTQTRYLVLWFTTLPQQGSGDFRLRVSEVSVR